MSETIDPITWLRDQVTSNRTITLNPKSNELEQENGSIRIPKDAQTAWKRTDGKAGYYTVGSLWLLIKVGMAKGSGYAREANKLGLPLVAQKDQKSISDYF